MSGPHAQYRTPSRPLIFNGVPVLKFDKHDRPDMRYVLQPGGTYVKGRCVDYQVLSYVATRHVLDYRPQPVVIGKHAGGRTKPANAARRAKLKSFNQRLVQLQKTMTIDASKLHMMMPG